MYAKLDASFFEGLPSTFISFDFFQHDTQATPIRQGLEPDFDFTAQFVLTVDDLYLHYAATSVLSLEVNRSWGAECKLVARADAPLRELLQGRRGRIQRYAQLFAIGGSRGHTDKEPQVVGSIVYEMRMRRDITTLVHSFMQRFPEVASLALAPARAGARTIDAVLTIKSCIGLKLRAHGLKPAPYVHFEFFDFGEQAISHFFPTLLMHPYFHDTTHVACELATCRSLLFRKLTLGRGEIQSLINHSAFQLTSKAISTTSLRR